MPALTAGLAFHPEDPSLLACSSHAGSITDCEPAAQATNSEATTTSAARNHLIDGSWCNTLVGDTGFEPVTSTV